MGRERLCLAICTLRAINRNTTAGNDGKDLTLRIFHFPNNQTLTC